MATPATAAPDLRPQGEVASAPALDLKVLDGIRGLAAAYVMVGHARWLLWEGHASFTAHGESYGLLGRMVAYGSAAFRFGHEAVILFFVLSGLVIHLRYARQLAANPAHARFDLGPYLSRRARRLYPPLLFAIALTWTLDAIGQSLGLPIYGGDTPYQLINRNLVPHHDVATLVGNLSFVMDAYVPPFGTNGPLWSLKYEAWFYLAYPLVWLLARRSLAAATALLAALFALSAFPGLWPSLLMWQIASKMFVWWLGAVLAEGIAGRLAVRWQLLAPGALILPVLPFVHVSAWASDLLWGIGFFGSFAAIFCLQQRGWRFEALGKLKWLGDTSYTLYVAHFPVLALMSGWLMSRSPTHELPRDFRWAAVGIGASLVVAYGAHLLVELPFTRRPASRTQK
jgi:peptidoglycan/LPS O-acetylase OafA/YrhL